MNKDVNSTLITIETQNQSGDSRKITIHSGLLELEGSGETKQNSQASKPEYKGKGSTSENTMTEKQRRYIFRLLAEQGLDLAKQEASHIKLVNPGLDDDKTGRFPQPGLALKRVKIGTETDSTKKRTTNDPFNQ